MGPICLITIQNLNDLETLTMLFYVFVGIFSRTRIVALLFFFSRLVFYNVFAICMPPINESH